MRRGVILSVILLLAFLIPSLLYGSGTVERPLPARKGVIDLSSYSFETQPPVYLDGSWEFRWDELLEPNDPRWTGQKDNAGYYPVPLFWTSYGNQDFSSEGQGSYRLMIKTSGESRYYGIKLPEIFSEYKLWINGELVDERWNSEGDRSLYLKPSTYVIKSESATLELILQVRNHSHSNAGIGQSIIFGSDQSIGSNYIYSIALDVALIAICLFAGIYHTIIFISRKEEKELLYFGFFCIILALRTLSTGSTLMMQAVPGLSFLTGSRIATVFIPLLVISFQGFSYYFFRAYMPKKIQMTLLGLHSAYLLLIFTTDPMVYSMIYSYYLLLIIATSLFIIGVDIYAITRKKDFSIIFFTGFLILFAGIANDMMHYLQIIITGYYLSVFFAGFILLESLMLSIKFSQEHHMVTELSHSLKKALNTANIDPLTGIYNRRYLMKAGDRELSLSRRYGSHFSLIMMDIDNFKRINDLYGHDAGDMVIIKLASILSSHIRSSDIPTRFGGDEFVLLLPQTGLEEARIVSEKIRSAVEVTPIPVKNRDDIHFTISMGIASSINDSESYDDMMRDADEMLYRSKENGRNRVSF